jgi:L-ascorbate metabolism protein UlaG (beta-lactamase superfamily)
VNALSITRIVNSCTLLEIDGLRVLTDPWFFERWHTHRGEPLGMPVSDLPAIDLIVGSNPFVNHWDRRGLAQIASKGATVVTPNGRMARIAKRAGFNNTVTLADGRSTTVKEVRVEAFSGGGLGPRTNVYVLSTPNVRLMFGGEACDVDAVRRWSAVNGPVQVAMLPVNGLSAFGRRLVMSAAEAVEAAAAAGADTLVAIHDAHYEDWIWRFIRRRSTARDCLPVRDRIAPAMRVVDLPTGRTGSHIDLGAHQIVGRIPGGGEVTEVGA